MSSGSTASGFTRRETALTHKHARTHTRTQRRTDVYTHACTHAHKEKAFCGSVHYFSAEVTVDVCYKTVHKIHVSSVVLGKNKTDPTKTATSKTATSYTCALMCSRLLRPDGTVQTLEKVTKNTTFQMR